MINTFKEGIYMTIIATLPLFPDLENDIHLTWENTSPKNLCWNLKHQTGPVNYDLDENFDEVISVHLFNFLLRRFKRDPSFDKIIYELPLNAKILSLGSGIGWFEIYLSFYRPDLQIFLVDGNSWDLPLDTYGKGPNFSDIPRFFNDTSIFYDCVTHTPNINIANLTMLGPDDDWPTDLDFVYSWYGYMWNFPMSFYSNKIVNSLKIGGFLWTVVINQQLEEIDLMSDLLNCPNPVIKYNAVSSFFANRDDVPKVNGNESQFVTWTKNLL